MPSTSYGHSGTVARAFPGELFRGWGLRSQLLSHARSSSASVRTYASRGAGSGPQGAAAAAAGSGQASTAQQQQQADGQAPVAPKIKYSPLHYNVEDFCQRIVPTEDEKKVKHQIVELWVLWGDGRGGL